MKLKTFMGMEVEGAYQEWLNRQKAPKQEIPRRELSIKAEINKEDYVKVPNTNTLIAKLEPDEFKGLTWEKTHYKLAENGLFMPSPALFMPYFLNVISAHNGKIQLYDGLGNIIPTKQVEDIYKHLTTNHINNGAWSHLDALFKNENDAWHIETDHRLINGELKGTKHPLETCLMEDCYTSLDFNKQGLATEKSNQEYQQGKNIKFLYPRNGAVARFFANSDRAVLSCGRDPQDSDAGIGVFSCVAPQKI